MDVVALEVLRHLIDMVNRSTRLYQSHLQTFSIWAFHQRISRQAAVHCSLYLMVLRRYHYAFFLLLLLLELVVPLLLVERTVLWNHCLLLAQSDRL